MAANRTIKSAMLTQRRIRNLIQNTHDCHPMADCINTDFSFQCQCKNGYFEDVGECFDADECVMKTHRKVSLSWSVELRPWVSECPRWAHKYSHLFKRWSKCRLKLWESCDRVRTFCKNTEGSYHCICRNGYMETKSKELADSGKKFTQWDRSSRLDKILQIIYYLSNGPFRNLEILLLDVISILQYHKF